MNRRRILPLLAPALLLTLSCTSGSKLLTSKFAQPVALAGFRGFTSKHAAEDAPRAYLAVASAARNELQVVDPTDNELVPSETLVFPLSVPTNPRPFKLVSASMGDGGADLLAVATQSPPSVQVVVTWDERIRIPDDSALGVDRALDVNLGLDSRLAGQVITSLAALSRPGGGAWLFVGLTGAKLAVLEFERDPDPQTAAARRPIRRTSLGLVVKDLSTAEGPFEPLDLAAVPGVAPAAARVFVATGDTLRERGTAAAVQGVGEVVFGSGMADPVSIAGLDARAPTRLLVAGSFRVRTSASSVEFQDPPTLQVMAVLDEARDILGTSPPERCGPLAPIDCGMVTLLPDSGNGGIAPDPAGELPFRAPVRFPSRPVALALALPAGGNTVPPVGIATPPDVPYIQVATGLDAELATTGLVLVGLASGPAGQVVAIDAARWGAVSTRWAMRGVGTRSGVKQVSVLPDKKILFSINGLLTDNKDEMPGVFVSAPGYLGEETFTLVYRGVLPALGSGDRIVGQLRKVGGQVQLSILGGDITHAALGVRVDDTAEIIPPTGDAACPAGFTARITALSTPSLVLSHAGAGTGAAGDIACADASGDLVAEGGSLPVLFRVRAQAWLLTGGAFGYAGRPVPGQEYSLAYQPDSAFSGGTRSDEEARAIARKARRRYYPTDPPCGVVIPNSTVTAKCEVPGATDPIATGPVLRFTFSLGCTGVDVCPDLGWSAVIVASSGQTGRAWFSGTSQAPTSAFAWLDAQAFPGAGAGRIYASLLANTVLVVDPSSTTTSEIR